MKKLFFLPFLTLIFLTQILSSQKEDISIRDISKGLRAYTELWSPEKIFIHTDKPRYTQGETIWTKAYLVDGVTHETSKNSNVLYLEILNEQGNVLSRKKGFVDNFGTSLSFHIHENTPDGTYTIRAYTKFMENDLHSFRYEREIHIGKGDLAHQPTDNSEALAQGVGSNLKLSFYPEGGQLVYGILGEVVVKAIDGDGGPVEVMGEIINGNGDVITTFDTGKYGLAKCSFTPISGNVYSARYKRGAEMVEQRLPSILQKGYTLTLENMGEHLVIKAESSERNGLKGTTLVGHMRGERFLWFRGDKVRDTKFTVRVPADELQDGIAHFTLFSDKGEAISERLAYVQSQTNKTILSLSTTKRGANGELNLDFELTDEKGIPAKGNFSVSVLTKSAVQQNASAYNDMANWLSFHSDYGDSRLAQEVFNESDAIRRRNIIDALMVAGDWKRFSWDDMSTERSFEDYTAPEKGIFVTGTTKSLNRSGKEVPAMVSLEIIGPEFYKVKKQTNTQGRFAFGPFDFKDSVPIVLKASRLNGRNESEKQKVLIVLDEQPDFTLIDDEALKKKALVNEQADQKQKNPNASSGEYTSEAFDFETGKEITRLTEVVVSEEKTTKEELISEQLKGITLYNKPTNRVFVDSFPQTGIRNIMYILRTLPGVQVRGPEGGEFVTVRYGTTSFIGSISPLFLIDGVPTSLDAVRSLTSLEVMFVDVLKGANAAIYGTRGANGVIAIFTHRGSGQNYAGGGADSRRSPHILTLTKKGYDATSTFESGNCGSTDSAATESPYAQTVVWEPDMDIFGSRHKTLTFCPDDFAAEDYVIRVQGISEDGQAISEEFILPRPDF